jgi:hypothetical protein
MTHEQEEKDESQGYKKRLEGGELEMNSNSC